VAVRNLPHDMLSCVWFTVLIWVFGLCLGLSIFFGVCVRALHPQGCNITVENRGRNKIKMDKISVEVG